MIYCRCSIHKHIVQNESTRGKTKIILLTLEMARQEVSRTTHIEEGELRVTHENAILTNITPTIQNELIELLATEVEKENLQQLKLAKYFSIILDCTPDMSHHEQMSVILRYVLCNEEAAVVKETFFGYLRISDSTGKACWTLS